MKADDNSSLLEVVRRAVPFDNRLVDAKGDRYLVDPLAETYIVVPAEGAQIIEGMLPPEEMQIRAAVVEAKDAIRLARLLTLKDRLFHTAKVREVDRLTEIIKSGLTKLVVFSPAHKAAAKRLRNSYGSSNVEVLDWASKGRGDR